MSRRDSSARAAVATRPRGSAGLWFAVFGPPAAWFVSLVAGYVSVHEVCRVDSPLTPRIVSLVALVIALLAGITGRAIWQRDAAHDRTRFMAQLGVLGGSLFSLIIVLQIVATFLIPTCHERPRTPASPDVLVPPATQSQGLPLT